jgi:hypothetical protein
MNINSKIRVLVFAAFLMFTGAIYGQQPTPTPDPIIKACEETANLAKRLEIERDSLKAQLDISGQKLSLKDEQIANKEEQLQFWKKAAETGDKIDKNSDLIILNLRNQIADDIIRIKDLEEDNKSLRRSRDFRTFVGLGAGFAAGYFTHK